MTHGFSRMAAELAEAPAVVAAQAAALAPSLRELGARLGRRPPRVIVTCARGSSAHAATFAKHLVERYCGIPVAAAAPVVASVYRRPLGLDGQLFLAISQSGRSDDLVEAARLAQRAGALTAALVNVTDSPLAAGCDIVLPIAAGAELSVAATKSFVASLSALLRWIALWRDDAAIERAVARLPERLVAAAALDWEQAVEALTESVSLAAIGRGPTLAIAREGALKLKEVCNIHAEAFSGAEFRHGPLALVTRAYPVMVFAARDGTAAGLRLLAENLRQKQAMLLFADPGAAGNGGFPGKALRPARQPGA